MAETLRDVTQYVNVVSHAAIAPTVIFHVHRIAIPPRLQLQSQLAAEETLKNRRQRRFDEFRRPREFLHVASVKEEKERGAAC